MVEHRSRLVNLAKEAYARAYGHCVLLAESEPHESEWEIFLEACYALDGLRVIAAQELRPDLLELIYWNYHVWDDVVTHGSPPSSEPEFMRRFAYALGLARGSEGRAAVLEAERTIDTPSRGSLIEEITQAVAKTIRSAPANQLADARSAAAANAGALWPQLPAAVRDQFAQGEYMERVLWHSSFDWAPVALPYFRGVELLLLQFLEPALSKAMGKELFNFIGRHVKRKPVRAAELTMGEAAHLLAKVVEEGYDSQLTNETHLQHVGRLRDVAGRLRDFNRDYRRLGTHAGKQFAGSDIRDLKRLLFDDPHPSSESFLSLLVDLRPRP
jgi:hypothetical protein